MRRSACLWIISCTALVDLWPASGLAQQPPGPTLSVEVLRTALHDAGFQVDPPVAWQWTTPALTTVHVRDGDRVFQVVVFADQAAAQAERLQAQAREALPEGGPGPHLVPGYGPSVWHWNVAVVQGSQRELSQLDSAALTALCSGGAPPLTAGGPAVDADVVGVLERVGFVQEDR